MLENTVVFGLVALCAAYSLWAFLPVALKRSTATVLVNSGLPLGIFAARVNKLIAQDTGCGSGCGSCSSSSAPVEKPVVWHYKK